MTSCLKLKNCFDKAVLFTESIKSKSDTCLQTINRSVKDEVDFDEPDKEESMTNFEVDGYTFAFLKAEDMNHNYDQSFYLPSGEPTTIFSFKSIHNSKIAKTEVVGATSNHDEIERFIDSRLLNFSDDIDFESIFKDKNFISLVQPLQIK